MGQRRAARLGALPFGKLFKLRRWLPGVLAVAAGLTGPVDRVLAQPAAVPVMPAPGVPGAVAPLAPGAAAAPAEKLVSLHFEKAPWGDVLDWYAKETGLTMITTVKPTGSVDMKPGKDRKFTMGEVTDLINETMAQQKFILIRRHMTFFIQPADEKIDPTLVPRLTLAELAKRGRTEIVQVILPIEGMVVADAQDELKKLLTPFGQMVALEKPNSILLLDTVGNIVRIQQTLDDVKGKDHSDSLNQVLEYRRAQEVAETLKTLLTATDVKVEVTGAQARAAFVDPRFGGGDPRFGGGDPRFGGGGPRGPRRRPGATTGARIKTVQIAVDARRNAILVTAPQDKIGLAKRIIEEQDKPLHAGDKKYVPAEPILRTFTVPTGSATEVAKAVQTKFPWLNVVPLQAQNQLMILGSPEDQIAVAKIINGDGTGAASTENAFIALTVLDPGEAAAALVKKFPTTLAGGPDIDPQKTGDRPGLLIKGTQAQIIEAKDILRLLGEPIPTIGATGPGPTFSPNSRTIDFSGGNAAVMADLFSKLLEARGNKVTVFDPLNPPRPPQPGGVAPPPKLQPPPVPPAPPMKAPGLSDLRQPLAGRDYYLAAAQIVDPEKKEGKPVTITVVGGRLIIQSEDTQALEVLAALAKYYKIQPTDKDSENLFKVIPLKYVSAEDAARELTEIFNGPQQQANRPAGGGGGLFGGGGGPLALLGLGGGGATAPAGSANPTRIRVVAEKSSNSLIVVKATPIDLLLIEKLLAAAIDGGRNDSAAVMKTFVLPLKNADAAEMATLVKGVYQTRDGDHRRQPAGGRVPVPPAAAAADAGPPAGPVHRGGRPQQQSRAALRRDAVRGNPDAGGQPRRGHGQHHRGDATGEAEGRRSERGAAGDQRHPGPRHA